MKKMRVMKFLRLNLNDDYNFGMGGANVANQLRGAYRFDKWMRNYKWWHAIFWWGFQTLLVNSYIVYCCFYQDKGLKPLSHYEYQAQVGKYWLDLDYFGKKQFSVQKDKTASMSSMSTCSTSNSRRSRIFESALNPMDGSLKCRFFKTISHLPVKPQMNNKQSYCQLHY